MNVYSKKLLFLAILVIAIIEAGIPNHLRIFGVVPNLLLVCIVILGFTSELHWVIIFAALAGLLKDILGIQYFGLNLVLFSFWGWLSFKLSKHFSLTNFFLLPTIIFAVCMANNILTQLILLYLDQNFILTSFLKNTFLGSIYSTVLSLIVLRLIKDLGYLQKP